MKSSRHFSNELEALIGEWVAYASIKHYYQYTYREFFPNFKDGDMTQKEMFENVHFEREHDSMLTNSAYLFDQVGISFSGPYGAPCKYECIKITIQQNIKNLQGSFIDFFGAAQTKSEQDYFKIELGCKPLFEQFTAEGYSTYLNDRFFWTAKIRPTFEIFGFWESKKLPTRDEKILASLSPHLIKQLNRLAATDQLIMAVKTLRDSKGLDLRTAKLFLEDFMFPEKWGKNHQPKLVSWYGPTA